MDYQNIIIFLKSWALKSGIKVAVILLAAWIIARLSRAVISRVIRNSIGRNEQNRAETIIKVFNSAKNFAVWAIAVLMILPEFGIDATPLLAGAGLVGLAIGMGAKNLIQNYLSGLFILLEDQYRIGEKISVAGLEGEVKELNLRRTVIKDKKGRLHHIPNGQAAIISNLSRKRV